MLLNVLFQNNNNLVSTQNYLLIKNLIILFSINKRIILQDTI